jgi:O-antigen ligase
MQVIPVRFVGFVILSALSLLPLTFVFPSPLKILPYAALLTVSIYLLCAHSEARKIYASFKPIALAFGLFLPYSLASIWLQGGILKTSDNALHFLFFLLISVCFRELPSLRIFWCGISAAAFGAGALAMYQRFGLHIERPYGMYGINALGLSGAIKFGMVTVVFSLLALLGALDKRTPMAMRLWHGIGALVGFAGCQVIGSRGPWLTLVVIGIGIAVGKLPTLNRKQRWMVLFFTLFFSILLVTVFHSALSQSLSLTLVEISNIQNGNHDTSLGQRIEMWKAAMTMFLTHPIFGVGMQQFGGHLQQLIASGQAPQFILIFGHAHNEYLEVLATGGIVGFAYLLVLFGAPLVFFLRHLNCRRADGGDTAAPVGGLVTVLSFILFAMGDNLFDRQMTTSLFAFLILGFTVMTAHRKSSDLGVLKSDAQEGIMSSSIVSRKQHQKIELKKATNPVDY